MCSRAGIPNVRASRSDARMLRNISPSFFPIGKERTFAGYTFFRYVRLSELASVSPQITKESSYWDTSIACAIFSKGTRGPRARGNLPYFNTPHDPPFFFLFFFLFGCFFFI